jgi:hypothetical protein
MKRILLALTFVAALGAAGLGIGSKAEAWHGCHDGYGYGHYGYRSYPVYYGGYYPSHSYRSHWRGDRGHRGHGHHGHGHHDHGGISFSFGF